MNIINKINQKEIHLDLKSEYYLLTKLMIAVNKIENNIEFKDYINRPLILYCNDKEIIKIKIIYILDGLQFLNDGFYYLFCEYIETEDKLRSVNNINDISETLEDLNNEKDYLFSEIDREQIDNEALELEIINIRQTYYNIQEKINERKSEENITIDYDIF